MLIAAVALTVAFGIQDATQQPEPMACEVGPVTRAYGQSDWLVYGCADDRSLVFVSAPGNPAMPFVFISTPDADGYRLYGEGSGSQDATRPAFEDMSQMTEAERNALLEETKAATVAVPSR